MKKIVTLCILVCSFTLTTSAFSMLKQCYLKIQAQQIYTQKRNYWRQPSTHNYPSDETFILRNEVTKLERQISVLKKENEMLLATIDNYNQTGTEKQKGGLSS